MPATIAERRDPQTEPMTTMDEIMKLSKKNQSATSSVFGVIKVKEIVYSEDKKYPYTLICEGDIRAPKKVACVSPLPVGTRIYWQYWYKEKRLEFHL